MVHKIYCAVEKVLADDDETRERVITAIEDALQ